MDKFFYSVIYNVDIHSPDGIRAKALCDKINSYVRFEQLTQDLTAIDRLLHDIAGEGLIKRYGLVIEPFRIDVRS